MHECDICIYEEREYRFKDKKALVEHMERIHGMKSDEKAAPAINLFQLPENSQ